MKQPFISIVLLNYNGANDTLKCLKSLEKLDYPKFEIILVDNGSTDNSLSALKPYIKKSKLNIRLICEKTNLGYSEGNNVGFRASKADYVVLLNNDTVVDKNWLKEAIKVMKEDDKIAIVGSEINNIGGFYGNNKTLGAVISLFGEPIHFIPRDKSFTFYVSGCSMLLRKSIIKEPFDKDYFIYGEDTALSWLVNLKGYKTKMAYKSKLDHLGGVVRTKISKLLEFNGEKNKFMNMFLFYEANTLIKLMPLIALNILIILTVSIPKARFSTRMKSYLWLIRNHKNMRGKRRRIQNQRKIPDKEIFKNISCHTPLLNNFFINKLFEFYCFIFRLPVLEFRK